MTETVKIEVQADVTNAQQGMAKLRDDLKNTKKEGDAVGSSFGEISRGLGSISPQLGRVTQSIGKLTDQMKKLGVQTGSNGAFGRMTSGLGRLTSSSGFRKGVGILGLGVAAGGILSSLIGGGGNNKLAGFDQLNAMGQETMMDFLGRQFKQLKTDTIKPIAEATTVTAENTTSLLELYRLANPNIHTEDSNLPSEIKDIVKEGEDDRKEQNDKGWKTINDTVSKWLDGIKDKFPGFTPTDNFSTVDEWYDFVDKKFEERAQAKSSSTSSSSGLLGVLGNVAGVVSSTIGSAVDTFKNLVNPVGASSPKVTITSGSGGLVGDVLAHLAEKSVNGGLLNESTIGSIIGMGSGGSAGASAMTKGASLLSKFGRLLGIPGFAEGGLFMPNQPQLAILGDNKSEQEVAAPKSMIVDAVREAMASMSGSATTMQGQSAQPIPITLEIDGRTLARILYDPLTSETTRRGGIR